MTTIYFVWIQGVDHIPTRMLENIDFVKKQNPDYNVILYDLELFKVFLKDKPKYLSNYLSRINKKCYAMVADYIRMILLYYNGGVYMDVKTRPKTPLNTFIKEDKSYVFYVDLWEEYGNHFLVANKGNTLYKDMIEQMCKNIDDYVYDAKIRPKYAIFKLTGTKLFTDLIENNDYDNLIKIEGNTTKKLIQYSCVKYHHSFYKSYKTFDETLCSGV